MLYAKKLVRDLKQQKGQALAVLSVTTIGVLLFVSSAGGYLDLRDSYAHTREELALADLHVDIAGLTPQDVKRARSLPGAEVVEARVMAALPVVIPKAPVDARVQLRLLSLPDEGEPALDRVLLLSGRMPEREGEVLLEKHLAQHHGLDVGDSVAVALPGRARALTVSGVAASAEYLWVARDEQDVMPSADAFGVGWMRRSALASVTGAASGATSTQLLVEGAEGADLDALEAAVRDAFGARASHLVREEDLPGVRLLQMDVDGYKQMAGFFPLLFLGVAAFIVASILSRLVDAQRALIGTFSALGVGRARVLGHYLTYALVLGGAGAVIGAGLGLASSPALTREYAAELGIPFVTAALHWDLALYGVLLGVGVAGLAGLVPALGASRLPPAAAMRPPRPSTSGLSRLARRLHGPLPLRLATRNVLGRPLRSLGTASGVAAAFVLVLSTGAMLDSMKVMVSTIFEEARGYHLRVDLVRPLPLSDALAEVSGVDGVGAVEGVLALPAQLRAGARSEEVLLQGLPDDGKLLRSLDIDGRAVPPTADGIVVTRAVADALGVAVGDEVRARFSPSGRELELHVAGLADAALGPTASARRADLQRGFGLGGQVTSLLLSIDGDLDAARAALAALPSAGRVEDLAALRVQIDQLMALGWAMLAVMLAFSVVLAAAILFNTATLGILERAREIATLRALGVTLREISVDLTLEHALLCAVGLAAGLPLAIWTTREVLAMYSGDLFVMPFVLSPATVVVSATGIVGVLLLAQWPALRSLSRASLADAVRSREG